MTQAISPGGLVDRSNPNYSYGVPLEGQVKSNGDVNIFMGDHADYKEESPYNLIGKISNDGVLTGRDGQGSVWNGKKNSRVEWAHIVPAKGGRLNCGINRACPV